MKNESNGKSLESQYPSVDLAYEFAKSSYDWMVTRLEAVDSKIQRLLTFAATIAVAFPVVAKSIFNDVNFSSPWFYGSMGAFGILVVIGIYGIRRGSIILVDPKILYDKYLSYSHWEFRQHVIYWAGEHFNANNSLIRNKAWVRDLMTIFLLVQILCIALWVAISI